MRSLSQGPKTEFWCVLEMAVPEYVNNDNAISVPEPVYSEASVWAYEARGCCAAGNGCSHSALPRVEAAAQFKHMFPFCGANSQLVGVPASVLWRRCRTWTSVPYL